MKKPSVGEQELELLRFVIDRAPLSVRQATEQFGVAHGLARTTILTMMERLRKKGYLTRKQVDGVHQYSPAVAKAELLRSLVRHFVEKTLAGSLSPFVAYLAQEATITVEELEQLKRLVNHLERQGDRRPTANT